MDQGWIKLHRKLALKGYYKKSAYVHLWIHLLIKANHQSEEFMWDGGIILVKGGQLITGRKQLSNQTGISETTIERILKILEKEGQIGQQKTTKYRLITILKWKEYQQTDNRRTTDGQQTDTNKNDKNDKNEENIGESPPKFKFVKPVLEEIQTYCLERKNNVSPQKFFDHYESNGWRVGRNPMKDWKAAVRTWERNEFNTPKKEVYKNQSATNIIEKLQAKTIK